MKWRDLVLGLLAGSVAGALATRALDRGVEPARTPDDGSATSSSSSSELDGASSAPDISLSSERSPAPPSDALRQSTGEQQERSAWLAQLRARAEPDVRRGWRYVREEDIPTPILEEALTAFTDLVQGSPFRIGRELAERETRREATIADQSAGGAMTLLTKLGEGGIGPLPDLVGDPKRMGELFRSLVRGPTFEGPAHQPRMKDDAEDGATFAFPVGVFALPEFTQTRGRFPRDVTICGAGMNATLLLVSDLSTRDELRNLTFRDCTLHTQSDALFDLRGPPATVQLTRVRLVGFDRGSGSQAAFEARGLALYVRNSLIIGGYAGAPKYGKLFDVRSDALLARFEGCTLDGVEIDAEHLYDGSTVAFVDCELTNLLDRTIPAEGPGLSFPGSRIHVDSNDRGEPQSRDLNEIFPNWRQRVSR